VPTVPECHSFNPRAHEGRDLYTFDSEAILSLAVAFEALLGLSKDAKTDRFVDAISLLLGRLTRLSIWAEQFYTVRSDVAHEGRTERLRLMMSTRQHNSVKALFISLC
jgi:hypothetical protein